MATAPPALPQRQSCDRCHKQKLRCTRENNGNGNGGVCDRCLRKRAQCVYSFSLPKGRPSLYRLADESTTSNTNSTENLPTGPATERTKPPAVCKSVVCRTGAELPGVELCDEIANSGTEASSSDADADADAGTEMNVDPTPVIVNPSTNEHSASSGLIAMPTDLSTGTWPWLETLSWDDMQLEVDWSSHDSTCADAVLTPLDTFGGNGSAREGPDFPLPTQPPCPPSLCYPYAHSHGQPQEKYTNYPSLVIAQLSQLSMRLSSLRYSSYTLAKTAESSLCRFPNGRQIPLIDPASFESVATWLAHGHGSANMNTNPPAHASAEIQYLYPSPAPETKPSGGDGILHDVFSASHHLLEILRCLQGNNIVEPFNSSTTSVSTSSAAASSQRSAYSGLTNGPGPSAPSSVSQQHRNNTMQIIRHLVMACETLLLEIYVAVLIALQHDAYPGASMNTMSLGDVRLVLVVQLCSYLIERQQQAVDFFLAPQSPLSPLSVSGLFPQKLDLFGSHQPVPVLDTADREALSDLKNQVQQRLAHLRQTLRCT